jgi:hypothetical protein
VIMYGVKTTITQEVVTITLQRVTVKRLPTEFIREHMN